MLLLKTSFFDERMNPLERSFKPANFLLISSYDYLTFVFKQFTSQGYFLTLNLSSRRNFIQSKKDQSQKEAFIP